MKIKKIISLVVLVMSLITITANAKSIETEAEIIKKLNSLTWNQRKLLLDTYNHGKEYGYADTLSGILMTESNFGETLVNPNDGKGTMYPGSYSAYQIHLNSFMKTNNLKGKKLAKVISTKLVNDQKYARNIAINMLDDWNEVYSRKSTKNKYKAVLASYNAGSKGLANPKGKQYAEIVAFRAKVIGKWLNNNKLSNVVAYKKSIVKNKNS